MKELKKFNETEILGNKIIMYGTTDYPLFMASDVADWIQHSNSRMMLKSIDNEEKEVNNVYTLGGIQEKWFLTEDGLYEVCMQSRKPIAKQMKKEIKLYLKQIRLTGGYIPITENDTDDIIMAKALKIADKTILEKDTIISQLQPKASAYDDLMSAQGFMSLKEVGDLVNIGRTSLCYLLRNNKVLSKQTGYNLPLNKFQKSGYFKVVTRVSEKGHASSVTMVSPKGLNYIYKLIKKNNMVNDFNTDALEEAIC